MDISEKRLAALQLLVDAEGGKVSKYWELARRATKDSPHLHLEDWRMWTAAVVAVDPYYNDGWVAVNTDVSPIVDFYRRIKAVLTSPAVPGWYDDTEGGLENHTLYNGEICERWKEAFSRAVLHDVLADEQEEACEEEVDAGPYDLDMCVQCARLADVEVADVCAVLDARIAPKLSRDTESDRVWSWWVGCVLAACGLQRLTDPETPKYIQSEDPVHCRDLYLEASFGREGRRIRKELASGKVPEKWLAKIPLKWGPSGKPATETEPVDPPPDARPCRQCGQLIRFVRTESGKLSPENLDGTTHWATCPHADRFRKPQPAPPIPDEWEGYPVGPPPDETPQIDEAELAEPRCTEPPAVESPAASSTVGDSVDPRGQAWANLRRAAAGMALIAVFGGTGLSEADLSLRQTILTATDFGVLAGHTPWTRPIETWRHKMEGYSQDTNEAMLWGSLLEPAIAFHYLNTHGVTEYAYPWPTTRHLDHDWLGATPDLTAELARTAVVQIKTSSRSWDIVPDHVIDQVHIEWEVLRSLGLDVPDHVVVAVLNMYRGPHYQEFEVAINSTYLADLLELGRNWWHKYVIPKTPPPVDQTDRLAVGLLYPKESRPELVRADDLCEKILPRLVDLETKKKKITAAIDKARAVLQSKIGESGGLEFASGHKMTWLSNINGTRVFRTNISSLIEEA